MLGRLPFRIDVLTGISGVSFATAWKHRTTVETELGALAVIGLAELRANKLAAGRPKDLADVALLDELALAKRPPRKRATPRKAAAKATARGGRRPAKRG